MVRRHRRGLADAFRTVRAPRPTPSGHACAGTHMGSLHRVVVTARARWTEEADNPVAGAEGVEETLTCGWPLPWSYAQRSSAMT